MRLPRQTIEDPSEKLRTLLSQLSNVGQMRVLYGTRQKFTDHIFTSLTSENSDIEKAIKRVEKMLAKEKRTRTNNALKKT